MPFLIDVRPKGKKYWVAAAAEPTEQLAKDVIAKCIENGVPADEIRYTELDEARINWRIAQDKADRKLRKYIKASDRAFNLKTSIRPRVR
jgi:hypothetical protein